MRWKKTEPKLRAALKAFMAQPKWNSGKINTDDNVKLEVIRALPPLKHYFCMGGRSGLQSDRFIIAGMLANIAHCTSEKLQKIATLRSNHPKWWLMLTDHIGLGLDDHDKKQAFRPHHASCGLEQSCCNEPT